MKIVGTDIHLYLELLLQPFGPHQADVAPGSDIIGDDADAKRRRRRAGLKVVSVHAP